MMAEYGRRKSELIRASTRHSMLLNQKEDTYHIIRTIAEQEGIQKIRIYNKRGTIIFSADESEINTTVDMQNEACYMCHPSNGTTILEPSTNERKRIFQTADGTRLLGFVTAIKNEESCYTSDCHYHTVDEPILGTLDVIMSLKDTDEMVQQAKSEMISAGIALTLSLALTVGVFIWFFVHIPVQRLMVGTKEISSGNLEYKIKTLTKDEMGLLAQSFNTMTEDLSEAKHEITEWSTELERRVNQKTEELKQTQERVLQIEKLASLGQLSATVAHELNNPIAGILTYSKLIQKKLQKDDIPLSDKESILKYLKMIETESDRSGSIVKNLLLFSRKKDRDVQPHQLNLIIEKSLQLIVHHLKLHNISLQKQLPPTIPVIHVDEDQLQQALLALFVNAVEAMDKDGILTVKTEHNNIEKSAYIYVQDNGKGIAEEDIDHIFEPFFTTKHKVKGVGLGLSVVYGIVQSHNGEIRVESELYEGTTFIIKLPVGKPKVEET
jgi:two-component system NtrC family sensor kinase